VWGWREGGGLVDGRFGAGWEMVRVSMLAMAGYGWLWLAMAA